MRILTIALALVATLFALVPGLPVAELHGAEHGAVTVPQVHHTPMHPPMQTMSPGIPDDEHDIACKALCTGPLLTSASGSAHAPAARAVDPVPDAPRLWDDWARPVSPPPKHLA